MVTEGRATTAAMTIIADKIMGLLCRHASSPIRASPGRLACAPAVMFSTT
jgi:hypothetical protein